MQKKEPKEATAFEAMFKPGLKVKGKVMSVWSWGAVVKLQSGIRALCPKQHMSEFPFENCNEIFKVGAVLEFHVLDCKENKIILAHKENLEATASKAMFKPGLKVKGKVMSVRSWGAVVRLRSGIRALCPKQHMSELPFENRNEIFKVGAVLKFRVLNCKENRISLTHKENLVESKLKILSSNTDALEGLVTHGWISRVSDYGYFVRFYHGVYGVALRSELPEGSVCYDIGQVVKCRIARIDPASRRIFLSLLP